MLTGWMRQTRGRIKGTVYLDANGNGKREEAEGGLKGVTLKLYSLQKVSTKEANLNRDTEVFRGKLTAQAETNEKGEYFFNIPQGNYSIKLELNTLPAGKGVVEQNIFVHSIPYEQADFAVREIASIEVGGMEKQLLFGENFSLNAALKDKKGDILAAPINYRTENEETDTQKFKGRSENFSGRKINICINSGEITAKLPLEYRMPPANSTEKVRLAYHHGLIDYHTKIRNLLYSIFDRSKLPAEFTSNYPIKSGTTVIEEISDYLQRRDADSQLLESARKYLSLSLPTLDKEYTSPSGYFKIHYTTSGKHAITAEASAGRGVPGYIRLIGETFDHVKSVTCGSRGFKTPVSEQDGKPFDVYVYDLKEVYGVTYSSKVYKSSSTGSRIASCYICIDNTYAASKGFKSSRDECMKVTAAHEFFHAVQNAYNIDSATWWKEASATWNEDEIYDGVNDYLRYLDRFLSAPEKSLEENSYGGVAFVKYISEKWGGYSTVKRIWELHGSINNSVEAIDKAIKEKYRSEDIGTIYNGFTACNFNPSQYYKEGNLWPTHVALNNTFTSFPVKSQQSKLNHLAANYQLFKIPAQGSGNILHIVIDGEDKMNWGFKLQKRNKSDNSCELLEVSTNGADNRVEILCRNCSESYKEICLIPANLEKEHDRAEYTFSAGFE